MSHHAPPITVGIDVADELRPRALWVLEALLAPFAVAWHEVAPHARTAGEQPQLGYGVAGAAHTIPHDAGAWQFDSSPPDAARDPVAAAFWWLARVEELLAAGEASAHDEHGRFRHEHAAIARCGETAPVDAIAAGLGAALGLRPAPWPGDHALALALSHDIDVPVRWTRQGVLRTLRAARASARAGAVREAAGHALDLLALPAHVALRRDPFMNCGQIAQLEARHGGRSTFYLIGGHHHPADGHAASYDAVLPRVLRDTVAAGGEPGVHGSYTSSVTPGRLAEERMRLERIASAPLRHHRFHYLRHRPVVAWPELDDAGFLSDSSLGFAGLPGFRAGFSHPFRAWSHDADRALDLVIVPLAIMDATFEPRYTGMTPAQASQRIDELLDHGARHGSAFSVLWHNDKLAARPRWWRRLYEHVLQAGTERHAWLASVGEVAEAWRQRRSGPDAVSHGSSAP